MASRTITALFGPPGTGKTTTLLDRVDRFLHEGGKPHEIAFCGFTRQSANEAAQRAMDRFGLSRDDLPHFRTLHSIAYRQLGLTPTQVMGVPDWKEFGRQHGLDLEIAYDQGTERVDRLGGSLADRLFQCYALARARQRSVEEEWRLGDWGDLPLWSAVEFGAGLDSFKLEREKLDFTDFLDECQAELDVKLFILDEAQDLTNQQWSFARRLAKRVPEVIIAGDDDQCQPPGSMVDTPRGPVPIESLEDGDAVISYDRSGGYRVGKRGTLYPVTVAMHRHTGDLIRATTESGASSCYTPGHTCLVRWRDDLPPEMRVVYLMRKGRDWRVGHCQLKNSEGAIHVWTRARLEGADAIWVLRAVPDKTESLVLENTYSYGYGIPQLPFKPNAVWTTLTAGVIARVYGAVDSEAGALRLLADLGLDPRSPLADWKTAYAKRGGAQAFTTAACNLLTGLLALPVADGNGVRWETCATEREPYDGPVYGLNVPKHHLYFADGILTHNCIFDWAGADSRQMSRFRAEQVVLPHSHRLPRAVHAVANRLVGRIHRRVPKRFDARDDDGSVAVLNDIEQVDLDAGEWLILARHRYQLDKAEMICRQRGYVYRREGEWSTETPAVRAAILYERLRRGDSVTLTEARTVASWVIGMTRPTRGNLLTWGDLHWVGPATGRRPWFDALTRLPDGTVSYVRALLRRGEKPTGGGRITLSTIHGSKGGEAPNVLILGDGNRRVQDAAERDPDSEHRVWYVGATRASSHLLVIGPPLMLAGALT